MSLSYFIFFGGFIMKKKYGNAKLDNDGGNYEEKKL